MKHTQEITIIAAIVVIVVVFTAILYPSVQQPGIATDSTSSLPITPTVSAPTAFHTSVTNATDNLQFTLQLTRNNDDSLTIKVDEVNLLDTVNNVTSTNGWRYDQNALNPFNNCPIGLLDGFTVASGYYAGYNATAASALRFYNTTQGDFSCSTTNYGYTYSFERNSDLFKFEGTTSTNNDSVTDTVSGYYNVSGASFQPFPPGVYTVIGADQFGNILLMHFTVSAGQIEIQGSATTTQTSSSLAIGTTSTSNTSDGLQFGLQVLPGGNGTFDITAKEVNLLSSANNVTAGNDWKYSADRLDPFDNCAPGVVPVGFAIFQGFYGMNNYSSGTALPLYNTTTEDSCTVSFHPNVYLFQTPLSDSILVYNDGQFRTDSIASASLLTSGYWTGYPGTSVPVMFHQFSGAYTVLGADTWGNVLLLHFTVAANSSTSSMSVPPSTTSTIQCSVSAEGTGFYVTVLSDTGQPIQGAQITGVRVTDVDYASCQHQIGVYDTNSTGSVLITPNIGSYYLLSIMYQGKNYTARASIEPMMTAYVVLNVPSGNFTVSEVYEGGCRTSTQGVTCPG